MFYKYLKYNDEVKRGDQFFDGSKWVNANAFAGEFVSKRSGEKKLFRRKKI